jgi:hypothetical protein
LKKSKSKKQCDCAVQAGQNKTCGALAYLGVEALHVTHCFPSFSVKPSDPP